MEKEKQIRVNEKGEVLRRVPLRVNAETIEDNKILEKDIVYVRIGGRKYPCIIEWVTEAVYRAYMRMEWADIKAMERADRCLIPDGKGGFIMCPECNKCSCCEKVGQWDFDSNHPVHLEALCREEDDDEGFDIKADSVNDARDMIANELADQIEEELRKIKPKYAIIFREMYNGNLQAINIAKNNNLSVSTTYEDIPKVMAAAQKIFALLLVFLIELCFVAVCSKKKSTDPFRYFAHFVTNDIQVIILWAFYNDFIMDMTDNGVVP